jgi:DNA repair exonuclease SbcCD ATPase subunit
MILESIQLRHVGLFTESVTVGPFSGGLNILAAANESGKTTLIKAATRALFDRHICKDQEIKTLQPAGSDLAPKIAVVFQVASGKFKIEKTFLLSPKCQLSEWKSNSWQLIAEGDEADKRLMTLLQSTQPGRGASNEAHWGMMRYLWARQGEPTAWPKWDGEPGQLIQNRLARVELDPLIDRLRADLWADYLENYTATGQAKANGPLKKADEELEQIDTEINEIQTKRRELERLQIDFQTLASQLSLLQSESVQKQKEAVEIRELAAQVELLGVELKSKQDTLENAKAFLGTIERDAQCADKLKTELSETKELLTTTATQAEGHKKTEATLAEKQTLSDTTLEEHQTKLAKIRGELERVQKLVKLRNTQKDSEDLESLSKKVSRHTTRQKELQEKRDGLPDVTSAKLNKLEAAQQAVREKKVQLDALGLTLELTPDKDTNIQISESGKKRAEVLKSKAPKTFNTVEQTLELKLESWGRISIRSGAKEIKNLADELKETENDFKESLLKTGVESVDAARMALASRKEFDQQIQATKTAIEDLLADRESVEKLEQEFNISRNRLAALEGSLALSDSEKKQSLADIEAQEQKLQVQVEQQDRAVKDSTKAVKSARTELDAIREERQEAEKQVATLKSKIQGIEKQIQNVASRYPDGIQKAKEIAQQTFVEAQAHLEVTKKKLPAEYEKLPQRNKRAAKAAEEVAAELENKRVQYNQMEGQLKALGSEGLYSKETELLERKESVSRIAEGVRARAWATRLVHDLIENRKQAATRSVLAPLEARLSSVFAEITGDHHRQVFLDESLQIRGTGRNQNELIEFGCLSQGAREQLLLALRLAVATELATSEPQLLILDDVLVNTDPTRQNRVLDLLRSAEQNLQILILTCHPERYRGIGSVLTVAKETVNS